jgi:hypothetical protein
MRRRTVLGLAAASAARVAGANERVRVGVIGCGARGRYVARWMREAGALIAGAADVYVPNAERLREESGGECAVYQDFRKMLERPDVDAVLVATPDHWHAGAAVAACAAGKHVYLEKPFAYSIREGRAVVEAGKRYSRIVQPGMQHRSAEHFRECEAMVREGVIGKVHFVRAWNWLNMTPRGIGGAEPGAAGSVRQETVPRHVPVVLGLLGRLHHGFRHTPAGYGAAGDGGDGAGGGERRGRTVFAERRRRDAGRADGDLRV